MKSVIQEELSGCGIAASAAFASISYLESKSVANRLGIYAEDTALWSDTAHVRRILTELGIKTSKKEIPFTNWGSLPNRALLSIKWHSENGQPFWHWVVFIRENSKPYVLDSKKGLKNNVRTDFGRMKPKWYIEVIE